MIATAEGSGTGISVAFTEKSIALEDWICQPLIPVNMAHALTVHPEDETDEVSVVKSKS
jgi:hypothetical protein